MADLQYYPRGFGLRPQIEGRLQSDYHSQIVDHMKSHGFSLSAGDLTFRLAAEFGFCYGVDRAVEYAYETRTRFPDRDIFITGEIIHNPHVNSRLREMGIRFLSGEGAVADGWDRLGSLNVVILPAFGVTVGQLALLRERGCTLVDTTCGSVLNVWKNVERYARDGFTSVIHGKFNHEETRATASRTGLYPGGRYLVVRGWRGLPGALRAGRLGELRSEPRPGESGGGQPDDDAQFGITRGGGANPAGHGGAVRRSRPLGAFPLL